MTDFLPELRAIAGTNCVRNASTRVWPTFREGGSDRYSPLHHSQSACATLADDDTSSFELDKLIVAHGDCVEAEAKAFVRSVFDWLL